MKNRLAKEQSPYLLQHSNNPIDWFPWCSEAFEKAEQEDKPIFLSIGYSTCHWCHVMSRESFEDEKVAEVLNKNFISIKVDKEERPDIDSIYMSVCQIITGRGGWPLSIFMTPNKKPFYAGTYFPKYSYAGRIGFVDLLNRIINLWHSNRDELLRSSDDIISYLISQYSEVRQEDLDPNIFPKIFIVLKNNYDKVYGGFGHAPKFPAPHNLVFLFNYFIKYNDAEALNMSIKTLEEMRKGGIYDQVGFGFHRYSTDEKWFLPHFEKMLYDQASLMEAYSLAYRITKDNFFENVALEIYDYLKREMLSEERGFYSAQDADSEGEEGKFYLWTSDEIKNIVQDKYEIVKRIFNLSEDGNHFNEASRKPTGKNVLYLSDRLDNLLASIKLEMTEYESIRKLLLDYRNKRIPPFKDDKILTDWNSLIISSLTRTSLIIDNYEMLNAAVDCYNFLLENLYDGCKLYHTYRNKRSSIDGFLDDYAFLIKASLDLYGATFDEKYLVNAVTLNSILLDDFWDDTNGGFYFSSKNNSNNILRTKYFYDGAIASGNSVQLSNLIRLFKLTANSNLTEIINKQIKSFASQANNAAWGFTNFLNAIFMHQQDSFELLIISDDDLDIKTIHQLSLYDNLYCLLVTKSNQEKIVEIAEWVSNYKLINNKTTYYLCRNFTCDLPTNDFDEVLNRINNKN